ncbi:hypothetical protein BDQ12DRAFT_685164 [Crucibulum laeve]|uniref:Uncharacterized protein n=1 Tax=Crucibulum laeve TaxID=68775 RepID=A0A5C3LXP0_9AGAR|nr:hypothetical protein BDQ12DRAFT_685164 [Crucibulum laeve]
MDGVVVPTDTMGFDVSLDLKLWLDIANIPAYHSFRSLYGIESLNELINAEKARILQIKKDQEHKVETAVAEEVLVTEAPSVLLFDPPPASPIARQRVPENVTESSDLNCPFAPNDGPREYFNVTSVKYIDRKLHYGDDHTLKAIYTIRRMFALDGTNYFEPKYRCSTYQELRSYGGEDELKYASANQD